ncbi:type I phosphodiesterase / nucleotide pyrophosphatase [bacterium BMS3Abin03]|nr:type I phosphodiesterase / nucleotide pyrophosphatase [bacterium BMS3Abin03]
MYFEATDNAGHKFGPDSPEINLAIARLDSTLGLLFEKLKAINMLDSVNIILVSDHGMTSVSKDRVINIEELLPGYECKYLNSGPVMMIQPKKDEVEKVYNLLKENEHHFKVYKRKEMPAYYHFSDNYLIYDLIVVADLGWSALKTKDIKRMKRKPIKGNHGYDNHQTDMQGIFFAMGPAIKKHYSTGTLNCIDVYPLLCKIFNIIPNSNIDGKLDRIEFILNEN